MEEDNPEENQLGEDGLPVLNIEGMQLPENPEENNFMDLAEVPHQEFQVNPPIPLVAQPDLQQGLCRRRVDVQVLHRPDRPEDGRPHQLRAEHLQQSVDDTRLQRQRDSGSR